MELERGPGSHAEEGSGDGIEGVFRPSFLMAGPGITSSVTAGPDAALELHGFVLFNLVGAGVS